jgi:hypothetical protein
LATWDKISKKYLDIATEDYFSECYKLLRDTALVFEKELLSKHGLEVVFCKARLQNVAYSYLYDVERYKDFHGSPDPNNKKKAAFFIKWIVKVSPFFLGMIKGEKHSLEFYERYAPIINSIIAVKLFTILTGENADKYVKSNFIYALHYDGASVNMMYALFER